MSRLLTPEDVAEMLGVSRRTVTRMAAAGELPAVRIGSQWRFREQSITDWQEARETGNPPRQRQASAPAIASVARPAALPVGIFDLPRDYVPVYGHLRGETATPAASPAAARGRSTKAKKKAV